MAKKSISLEHFFEEEKSHCYRYIDHEEDQLDREICIKIKNSIRNKLERDLTREEFRIFKIFTGQQEKTFMYGVNIQIGNSSQGIYHILIRHFRDNGDRNGGRVEYIDMMLIPEILNTVSPDLQDNGNNVYRYTKDGKKFVLITYEISGKWFLNTFFTDDKI